MPLYDWICPVCGKTEDTYVSVAKKKPPICDKCNVEMRQLFLDIHSQGGCLRPGYFK